MKTKLKLLALFLALAAPVLARAQLFIYTTNSGAITITGYVGPDAVTIPDSINGYPVEVIGRRAFYNRATMTSVVMPDSVTSIGDYAFQYCSGLTSVTMGSGITGIGAGAFDYCSNLTSVAIPDNVTSIGNGAFDNCSSLTSIAIPNGVTNIGNGAFQYCSGLMSVTIPASVATVGNGAFATCSGLTNVVINNSVIGYGEFGACTNLTRVTIHNSVTNIGDLAFGFNTGLTNLTFLGNAPVLGGNNVFVAAQDANFNITAYDPATVYYHYGTTGWGATYGGLPTVMLGAPAPQIGGNGGEVSIQSGQFSFGVTGVMNQTIVVEASTDLVNWQPVWTNTLSDTSTNFTDSQWTNYPTRFYRAR